MPKNGRSRKIWGTTEISAIARFPGMMLNKQPGQKVRLFSKKSSFFLPPEGPDAKIFFLETLVPLLPENNKCCRFRQQMLFLTLNPF